MLLGRMLGKLGMFLLMTLFRALWNKMFWGEYLLMFFSPAIMLAKVDLSTGKLNSEWEAIWNGTGGLVSVTCHSLLVLRSVY